MKLIKLAGEENADVQKDEDKTVLEDNPNDIVSQKSVATYEENIVRQ